MITQFGFQNFKAWEQFGPVPFAPLTVLFGSNSSGKSSVAQFLLMLKQTVESPDRKMVFNIGSAKTAVDLGSFHELVFEHDEARPIRVELGWTLPERLELTDSYAEKVYAGEEARFAAEVGLGAKGGSLAVGSLEYIFGDPASRGFAVGMRRGNTLKPSYELTQRNYDFVRNPGRKWPITAPVKCYVLVRTPGAHQPVNITDVGFGISQFLPVLVQCYYVPPGSVILIEQPEIHLHPSAQAWLADLFIDVSHSWESGRPRKVQLIIESHSEHFLRRLQRRIAERRLERAEVAAYFCRPGPRGAQLEALDVDMFGNIRNWPDHFFGDTMGDAVAMTNAQMQRLQQGESPHGSHPGSLLGGHRCSPGGQRPGPPGLACLLHGLHEHAP